MAINTYLAAKTKKLERIVRIGNWTATPFSAALAQAQADLRERGTASEIVAIDTEQEKEFVREAQAALLRGDIDLAVCELSALPTEQESSLAIFGLSARMHPAETLLIRQNALDAQKLLRLPEGATVASNSALSRIQLLAFRTDLRCAVWESGNPGIIAAGLPDNRFEAFLLPSAVLAHNSLPGAFHPLEFNPEELVPAPGKGALAWLGHRGDLPLRRMVQGIHRPEVSACTNVERGVLRLLGGDLEILLGVYCRRDAMGNYHVFAVWTPEPGVPLKRVRLSSSTHFKLSERVVGALHA